MKLKLDDQGHVVVQDGKPVYVHDDGRDIAFDAPAAVSRITALNSESKGHREAKEAAELRSKLFEGIEDPDAARHALETLKNIDEGKLMQAGKVEEIKAAAARAAQEQVQAASKASSEELGRIKQELGQRDQTIHGLLIGGSFKGSKLISEKFAIPADMVEARFGSNFKVEDGKVVAYDGSGNKVYSRSRPGELADFDEALETIVDTYTYRDNILKGSGATGSGAQTSTGRQGGKSISRSQFDAMSPADQSAAATDKNTTITD
jgi:hypothetical protein